MSKVIVIGGGPSGMMAALTASKNHDVTLIERNNELGKKLKLTGGGRCNITNNRDIEDFFDKIVNNKKFLYSSLYTFTNKDLLDYFSSKNLEYKVEDFNDNKVYTKSDKATEVIDLLYKDLKDNNVNILFNTKVVDLLIEDNTIKGVLTDSNDKIFADKVIISTGGKSYTSTGSDGLMYSILEKHNHKITPIYPALIPLTIEENWIKNLQGISLQKVELSCKLKKKKISKIGDMLFAHFGITGPGVLIMSSYINKALCDNKVTITIDTIPNISTDELSNKLRENPNKNVLNNLKGILPQNFLKGIFDLLGLSDKKANELTKKDENRIIEYLKNMQLTCNGTLDINASQVTSGGVSIKEINSSTMESKIIKNLYLTGEVIDIDAETGGYNLQMAFSTGYLAGLSV